MRHLGFISSFLTIALASSCLWSCVAEQQAEIDRLNEDFSKLEKRLDAIEKSVTEINNTLGQLSVLADAVQQNFYVTAVVETEDGYELTLSNGCKIILQNGPDNTLTPMPAINMTQIGGLFYWTLNGFLLSGADGTPIHSSGLSPILKYDYSSQQYLISLDGGVTFQSVNAYSSLVINDAVLMQVINTYFTQNSTLLINQQMLFQIVSTYIQQNYSALFNIEMLDEVVADYIRQNYTRLFNYELLEEVFSQYDYEYYTSQIDVDRLVGIIVAFIQEHLEIFENSEVLFEIISTYISVNKTAVFSSEMLLEVINSFIESHENFINVDMLTQVVSNYIDVHRDEVFNTGTVRNMLAEYVQRYYVQIFSQNLLMQVLSMHLSQNSTTIFNETLIREIINSYVQNNYTTIFTQEILHNIITTYIEVNSDTVINVDVLYEVISAYFQKNYSLFIDRDVIIEAFNTYIEKHQTTIISADIIEGILTEYLKHYYKEIFSYDVLSAVINNYFSRHTELLREYISSGTDIIQGIDVSDDRCIITLSNGQKINLVVYDAFARLRDRVQSIVILPEENGHVHEEEGIGCGFLHLTYLVSPASMAEIIQNKVWNDEMSAEIIYTDDSGKVNTMDVFEIGSGSGGRLYILQMMEPYGVAKTVALHIKENKSAGTDIMTEFTPVDSKPAEVKLKITNVDVPAEWGGDFDILKASIYNSGTNNWSDFRIISDHHGNYSTDPEIILDDNDHYVVAWSDLDLDRTDNYIHFDFINSLHYGRSNNVNSSSPNAYLSMKPQNTHVSVNVTNYGSDDLSVKGCWLLWTDAHSSSRLATNANLLLESGELSSINYTSYYRRILSKSYIVKPGKAYYFGFDIIPLSGIGAGVLTVQLVLDNGDEILKDAYELIGGVPGGSFGWSAGDQIEIPFYKPDSNYENGHEWVDLGLSVKWATCNVGATKPEEYGDYFAWGETAPKHNYDWSTYKWCKGSCETLTKYNTSIFYGTVDNNTDLDIDDDAAHANWGGSWRLPTKAEQDELTNNCIWIWTTKNGINGSLVTGPNGNSIFLPAAGYCLGTDFGGISEYGYYWSSSLSASINAYFFRLSSNNVTWSDYGRHYGFSVRPVCNNISILPAY